MEMEDMVHKAIKVERQLKRRGITRVAQGPGSSPWKPNYTKEEKPTAKPKIEPKQDMTSHTPQGKFDPTTSRTRDIKCFKCQGRGHIASQCPNKRVMVMRNNGEIEIFLNPLLISKQETWYKEDATICYG